MLLDDVFILPLKLSDGCESAFEDVIVDCSEVVLSLFKLMGVKGDEFIG